MEPPQTVDKVSIERSRLFLVPQFLVSVVGWRMRTEREQSQEAVR